MCVSVVILLVRRVTLEQNIQHDMFGKDYFNRKQYSADLIHQRALQWLDKQDRQHPFLGIFTYTLPHAELAQPEDSLLTRYERRFFVDKTWGGQEGSRYNPVVHTHAQFAAMISRLDEYVGQIMRKLKEKGIDDNTLLIFASDNGPHEEGGADPAFFGRDGKLRIEATVRRRRHTYPVYCPMAGHEGGTVNDLQQPSTT